MNKHRVHRHRRRHRQDLRGILGRLQADTPDRRPEDIPDHRDASVRADRVRRAAPAAPAAGPAVPQSAASGVLSARRKFAGSAWTKSDYIDYKKAEILAPFLQERGKILPRRMTGTCSRHQRWLTVAIKRAQNIALLPFAAEL